MEVFLFIKSEALNVSVMVGVIGGAIGIIAGLCAIYDRFKNRKPNIKVFAPYQWTGMDSKSGEPILSVYFRISNLSQTPAYLFLETLEAEIYYSQLEKWEKIYFTQMPIDKPKTSFTEAEKTQFGIGRAKFINIFDNCIIKYGEPLCGYLQFHISKKNFGKKYTKLSGRIMDSRHKKITFEVDFVKQKEHDPNN